MYTLLPSMLSPPTLTVTSLAGLTGLSGLDTSLVSTVVSLVTWMALFLTVYPSLTLTTLYGMTTW